VKNNKTANKNGEDLALETVQSSSLFAETPTSIPPIQSAPYIEGESEETIEDFDLQAEEAELAAEEEEEISAEAVPQEEIVFQPQDITWEYLKGLEKIFLRQQKRSNWQKGLRKASVKLRSSKQRSIV
jgi:hypothetical protein